MDVFELAEVSSPIGALTIAAHGHRVCALYFGKQLTAVRKSIERWYGGGSFTRADDPADTASALHAYFDGKLDALEHLDVELNGTAFQQRVWQALRAVQPGTTASYSDVARAIGARNAVRAVGAANGANPIALIVPCHRIIGANGTLTGYGGGLNRKQWLLHHERAQLSLL